MEQRYMENPYDDYKGQPTEVDKTYARNLIKSYVEEILEMTKKEDSRGDLYVGDAGFIFYSWEKLLIIKNIIFYFINLSIFQGLLLCSCD